MLLTEVLVVLPVLTLTVSDISKLSLAERSPKPGIVALIASSKPSLTPSVFETAMLFETVSVVLVVTVLVVISLSDTCT